MLIALGFLLLFAAAPALAGATSACEAAQLCPDIPNWGQFGELVFTTEPRPGDHLDVTIFQTEKEFFISLGPMGRFDRSDLWFNAEGAMAWRSPNVAKTAECTWHYISMAMLLGAAYPALYALERAFPHGQSDVGETSKTEIANDASVELPRVLTHMLLLTRGPWRMNVLAQKHSAQVVGFSVTLEQSNPQQTTQFNGQWMGREFSYTPSDGESLKEWDVCVGDDSSPAARVGIEAGTGGRTSAFSTFGALRKALVTK
jgi:hypothetical protein